MKKFLLLLVLCGITTANYAQNKEIDAIAAYQMAEERFEKKEYREAINSLDVAKKFLGNANSKMLYLEILAWQGLCEELSSRVLSSRDLEAMEEAIVNFEQAPDVDQFLQEKRVEVAKIKMSIPNRKQIVEQAEKQAEKHRNNENKAIQQILALFPPCGVSLESFVAHPYASQIDKLAIKTNRGGENDEGGISYHLLDGFTDNAKNERVITSLNTDNNNQVIFYKVEVEINEDSVKKTIAELFGLADYDNILTFDGRSYDLFNGEYMVSVLPKINTSIHEHKRNKKRKQINYIELAILKMLK